MKKMNEKKKYLLSTVLATSLLFGSIIPVKAEIKLGELGEEANLIAASVAGVSYSSDVVALDDLGISVAPSDYVAIQQVAQFPDGFKGKGNHRILAGLGLQPLKADAGTQHPGGGTGFEAAQLNSQGR